MKPFVRLRTYLFIKLLSSIKRKDPRAKIGGYFKEEGIDKVKCHKEGRRIKTTKLFIECDKEVNSGLDENDLSGLVGAKTKVLEKWMRRGNGSSKYR